MTPRRLTTTALLTLLVLPLAAPAQTPEECSQFDDVAILVTNSLLLQKDVVLTGDLVANTQSPGPVIDEGAEIALDRNATVSGSVRGDTVDFDTGASAGGGVECNTGSGVTCTGLTLPVLDPLPPFAAASVRATAANVAVGAGATVTLGPGEYGDVTIAQGGTLVLTGGTYHLRSVASVTTAGGQCPFPCRQILYDAPAQLRVQGRFAMAKDSRIAPSGGGATASDFVAYVGGANGASGLLTPPLAADIGRGSTVHGSFYAPLGTFLLARGSTMTGGVIARDAMIDTGSSFTEDTFFANKAPVANDQAIDTLGASQVQITLTGTDPEGGDLAFSIVPPGPSKGSLGPVSPITPAPVSRCSVSGGSCSQDSDCPLYPNEVCETVTPPINSATVTYFPSSPSLEEEDSFTFLVTDECGLTDTGTVTLNPDDPSPPAPGPDAVDAFDVTRDTTPETPVGIPFQAAAPDGATVTFSVQSLPGFGSLADSGGNPITSAPTNLSDNTVVYTPDPGATSDSFTFGATDGVTSDTATASIVIGAAYELAPDQQRTTGVDRPIQITLFGNPGGTGSGGGQAPVTQTYTSDSVVSAAAAPPAIASGVVAGGPVASTGSGNGGRAASSGAGTSDFSGQPSGPHNLVFDAGWAASTTVPPAFFWGAGEPVFAQDGPFEFTGAGCLSVTDDFQKGDEFRIYDNNVAIGDTSDVAVDNTGQEVGPDAAYADATYSSGTFRLGSGSHSITIEAIASPFGGGRGYIRVDSFGTALCPAPDLEVTSFTAPVSAQLDDPIGDFLNATVRNNGPGTLPAGTAASIGYYTSLDANITTDDRLLAGGRENLSQQAPNGLAVGESVNIVLFSGANISSTVPDSNPITGDNVFIGVLVDEFDEVPEANEGNNSASLGISVSGTPGAALTWSILSLPSSGTLKTLSGSLVTVGQTFTVQPTLVYTPPLGFTGSTSFEYQVVQGTVTDTALVDILVALGNCLAGEEFCDDGRNGGAGGQAPLEAPPGSPTMTLGVEGPGTVAAAPLGVDHGRVTQVCSAGSCDARFVHGETVVVAARPLRAEVEFVGWRGDCSGDGPLAVLTVGEGKRCIAVFRAETGGKR